MIRVDSFDMGGVIVNSEPIHHTVEMNIIYELGLNMSDEEYSAFTGTTTRHLCILAADKVPDPHALEMVLKMNGEERMGTETSEMLHKIPAVIEAI